MVDLKVWQYTLDYVNGEGWAIIILREDGFLSAVSDFGNYAYRWPNHGRSDFREFLLRAERDWDYFAKKLNPNRHLDSEASLNKLREELLRLRRTKGISKKAAQETLYLINGYSEDWEGLVRDPEIAEVIQEPWRFAVMRLCSDVVSFCKIILPRLSEVLRKQLLEEKSQVYTQSGV